MSALASFLDARHSNAQWLVRVEDLDPPREVEGSAERILDELQRFGLEWDAQIIYQSTRTAAYRAAADQLLNNGLAFWCGCSRSELPPGSPYPGTCRQGLPEGKSPRALRLLVDDRPVTFTDRIQGDLSEALSSTVGDFVIWRADGLPAYQLAVAVDDAWQGITDVVRGADLLSSTARQIHVLKSLDLPVPQYAHIPVACGEDGRKLSKREASDPLAQMGALSTLRHALTFLGQAVPDTDTISELLGSAAENWDIERIPRSTHITM